MKTTYSGKEPTQGGVTIKAVVSGQELQKRKANSRRNATELKNAQQHLYPGGDNDANHVIMQGDLCVARRGLSGISKNNGGYGRFEVVSSFNGMIISRNIDLEEQANNYVFAGVSKSTYNQRDERTPQNGIALIYRGTTTIFYDSADMRPCFPGDILIFCVPPITPTRNGTTLTEVPNTKLTVKLKPLRYELVAVYHKNVIKELTVSHKNNPPYVSATTPPITGTKFGKNDYAFFADRFQNLYMNKLESNKPNGGGMRRSDFPSGKINAYTKKSAKLKECATVERGYTISVAFKIIETLVSTGVLVVNTPYVAGGLKSVNVLTRYGLNPNAMPPNIQAEITEFFKTPQHPQDIAALDHIKMTSSTIPAFKNIMNEDEITKKRENTLKEVYGSDIFPGDFAKTRMIESLKFLASLMGLGDATALSVTPGSPNIQHTVAAYSTQSHIMNSFCNLFEDTKQNLYEFETFYGINKDQLVGVQELRSTMKYYASVREKVSMELRNQLCGRIACQALSYADPNLRDPVLDINVIGGRPAS
jgi:hypothetical protein